MKKNSKSLDWFSKKPQFVFIGTFLMERNFKFYPNHFCVLHGFTSQKTMVELGAWACAWNKHAILFTVLIFLNRRYTMEFYVWKIEIITLHCWKKKEMKKKYKLNPTISLILKSMAFIQDSVEIQNFPYRIFYLFLLLMYIMIKRCVMMEFLFPIMNCFNLLNIIYFWPLPYFFFVFKFFNSV